MSAQKTPTVEDVIRNSEQSENLQNNLIEFCRFLKDNEFSIEPEGHTEDNKSGWKIVYTNECIGHMNFTKLGIWLDTCDFGNSDSADDALKETAWAHIRLCEYFTSDGKKCGCHDQPGLSKVIFGKKHENLCFALLEFKNPDAKTIENIKKLLLLFKQNNRGM